MKKLFSILLAVFILCSVFMSAFATVEKFENVYELYEYWTLNDALPEWVASISSTDGSADNLTITLVEGYEDKEDDLRTIIKDASTLTIVTGASYSEAEMKKVQEEIVAEYMGPEAPVVGVGIGWAVIDGEVTGFGESGTESRVCVTVLPEYYEEYSKILSDKYGAMVHVEIGNMATTETAIDTTAEESSIGIIGGADGPTAIFVSGSVLPLFLIAAMILALIVLGVVFVIKRR